MKIELEDWFLAYEEGPFGTSSFDASKVLYSDLGNIEGESFQECGPRRRRLQRGHPARKKR